MLGFKREIPAITFEIEERLVSFQDGGGHYECPCACEVIYSSVFAESFCFLTEMHASSMLLYCLYLHRAHFPFSYLFVSGKA